MHEGIRNCVGSSSCTAFFAGIEKARFKKIVTPGDRLDLELEVTRDRGRFVMMKGIASVGGETAAEATLMTILAE